MAGDAAAGREECFAKWKGGESRSNPTCESRSTFTIADAHYEDPTEACSFIARKRTGTNPACKRLI
jgi:hypothetical protein